MLMFADILAQQPTQGGGGGSTLSADTIFWATILLIFVITIFSAMLRRLAKDKALKLFDDYHVTFFSERRQSLWGDMEVYSHGIELRFDHPFKTRRQVLKSSALIYEDEFGPMIALTRSVHGLTEQENKDRERQIRKTFTPGLLRRTTRFFRNVLNTLRDAITKTMSLMIGRFTAGAGGGGAGAVIQTQAGDINALTGTVVSLAANAYEPLLERYIGHAVVVEINLPPPPPPAPPPPPNWVPDTCEFPGYLVDYSQRFVAVFNVDHSPVEVLEIKLEPGKPAEPDLADLKITTSADNTLVTCTGKDAFVLRKLTGADGGSFDLGIALIPGTSIILAPIAGVTTLVVERTRHLDLVVPRSRARIRFGAVERGERARGWAGMAPILEPKEVLQTLKKSIHETRQTIRETLKLPGLKEKPEARSQEPEE